MEVKTHGVPNHPTGRYPETRLWQPVPTYKTKKQTYYFPLSPRERAGHTVTNKNQFQRRTSHGADWYRGQRRGVFSTRLMPEAKTQTNFMGQVLRASQPRQSVPLSQISHLCELAVGGRRQKPFPAAWLGL